MDASVDALSATTGATAEEEDAAEDAGMTVALARSGATGLVRTAGRTSIVRRMEGPASRGPSSGQCSTPSTTAMTNKE